MDEAQQLLIKIDTDNERLFGPIKIYSNCSNMYINELEHRRWMHPDYQKYQELKLVSAHFNKLNNSPHLNTSVKNLK